MKLSPAIEGAGYGLSGDIGGLRRQVYYTPDGRVIRAFPDTREYVLKDKAGKVVKSGIRDANLDRGWLLSPLTAPKPFCGNCGRWHDTQAEVEACGLRQNSFIAQAERLARQEEADKTSALEKQVAKLTALVEKLSREVQIGAVLQQEIAQPPGVAKEARGGEAGVQ